MEFERRAGPLTQARGFPSKEALQRQYGEGGDYLGVTLAFKYPAFFTWLEKALRSPFRSEGDLLEFALTAPHGLRWVMEAGSYSGFGFIELIRRCRFAMRSPDIHIEPRLYVVMELTNDEIPFFYVSPPEIREKSIATRLFFHYYLLRIRKSPHAGILSWVGPAIPPEDLVIHSPAWNHGSKMAVHPDGGILPSRGSFSSFWRKIAWNHAFPDIAMERKNPGLLQRADGIAIAASARQTSSCPYCVARNP